jgi:hypothetical protein
MTICTKMETVYGVTRLGAEPYVIGDRHMRFEAEDREFFWMTQDDWEDMGKPEAITVTIQPGDLLNNEPKAEHPELPF